MITQEEKYGLHHGLVKGVPTADAVSKWAGDANEESARVVSSGGPVIGGDPWGYRQRPTPSADCTRRGVDGSRQFT